MEWLNDNRSAVFGNSDGGLSVVDVVTGETKVILTLDSGSAAGFKSVQADGRWIYFTIGDLQSDIWMLELQ